MLDSYFFLPRFLLYYERRSDTNAVFLSVMTYATIQNGKRADITEIVPRLYIIINCNPYITINSL